MRNEYNTQVYKPIRAFIYCFISWIFIMAAFALMAIKLKIKILFPIGFIFTGIIPFLFQKKIKNLFTKRAVIGFDSENFSITTHNLDNDDKVKKIAYRWDEVKSYKFYFTASKITYMDIYLKNGSSKEFGFKDNKTEQESIKVESIYSIFRTYINLYNTNKGDSEKIDFAAGFLTTFKGLIILYFLGILVVADIILHITKYDTSVGFLIMAFFMLITLIAKRKQQQKFYKKMNDTD